MNTSVQSPLPDRTLRWLGHQRWLRYGVRERVLKLMRHPDRAPDRGFVVPFAGYAYPGNHARLIDWIVYYFGAYELDELELMRSLMASRVRPVALDVGANVGHHTLFMASFCHHVHTFEPYEGVGRHIDDKIHRNQLRNVTVHRVGLGEQDEQLQYYAPAGANTGTGTFVASHETGNNRPAGFLRLVRGDDYVESLQLASIDLVKIDVEGFELQVIRGLRRTFERYRPTIMLELSDHARAQFADQQAFFALFPSGYRAEEVHGQRNCWGLLGRRGCDRVPLQVKGPPHRGGYVNVLLSPDAGSMSAPRPGAQAA